MVSGGWDSVRGQCPSRVQVKDHPPYTLARIVQTNDGDVEFSALGPQAIQARAQRVHGGQSRERLEGFEKWGLAPWLPTPGS